MLREGDSGPEFRVGPITRTDIVRYAGASTDFNPLHHDDEHARSAGYPSLFAHGMLSAGILASFLTKWFGAESVLRYAVQFRDIVFPGDILSVTSEVTSIVQEEGRTVAHLKVALNRQTGSSAVVGSATVLVNDRFVDRETSN
jgi:acyl dehydratase